MSLPSDEEIEQALAPGELQALAERLAKAIDEAHATPVEAIQRFIVFRVGELRAVLPLTSVREVVEPRPLSRVPRAPEAVLGIMNLRGRVVAVVDLLLALPGEAGAKARGSRRPSPGEALEHGRILLLDRGRREIGLLVDEVEGMETGPGVRPDAVPLEPAELAQALEALVD